MGDLTLLIQRHIRAPIDRVFDAWTRAELVEQWWGPEGVHCPVAEFDLCPGGAYRIANQLPDGSTLWLTGEFEVIEAPVRLVYTWRMGEGTPERVTVLFREVPGGTDIVIRHEHIADDAAKVQHGLGWHGCVDGLSVLLAPPQE